MTGGGPEITRGTVHSEQTAREIDQEVRRIIDESIQKVHTLLENRRASLEALAKRLIEREVIDGEEMKQIIDETSTSPWIAPGTNTKRASPPGGRSPGTAGRRSGGRDDVGLADSLSSPMGPRP